jgi:peptidoglycan/xylan/chitin deacetylase (PgdA/CDA1 family)
MLKRAARAAFHHTGVLRFARWVNRNGLRILMYHRFPDRAGLEAQCRHLRACYRPLSMSEVADRLKTGEPFPANSAAVTVDDGYRDFLEVAYPIFAAHGISATVFLVTGFLDGNLWLWVDQVRYACLHTKRQSFRLGEREFVLGEGTQRGQIATELCETLKLLPNEERLEALRNFPELLQVSIPERPPQEYQPLAWDDVRMMARHGMEFGAHTRTHPVLSRVCSAAELADEIAGSKRRMEEMLDGPVRHFCYPNGARQDIGIDAVDMVRESGFHTAVTTEAGLNFPGADRYQLRRIGVDSRYEEGYFQRCAAAFRI